MTCSKQADLMAKQIAIMKRMYELQQQLTAITHHSIGATKEMAAIVEELQRSHCGFRGFLAADSKLLLLGKALLRYPDMLVVQVDI